MMINKHVHGIYLDEWIEKQQKNWTIVQDDLGYSVRAIDNGQIIVLRCACESDAKTLVSHLSASVISQ